MLNFLNGWIMAQVKKQAPKIESLLDASVSFYRNLLGYGPENTNLLQIPDYNWDSFTSRNGFNPSSYGIYLPRNQTAIIRGDSPFSLFHEFFGHGLFCEQSLVGRKLVELEKKLYDEEAQLFPNQNFSLEDVGRLRQKSETFKELDLFRMENLTRFESFAIWTEYLLSKEFSIEEEFQRRYSLLTKEDKDLVESIIYFHRKNGALATFYAQGLARRNTSERVGCLLNDLFKRDVKKIKFALLYGSKKEFSDIDVFVVSDDLHDINSWLDLRVYGSNDFERRADLLDIAITNPVITGEFILGDRSYYEFMKRKILQNPISESSISHNLQESFNQKSLAERCSKDSRDFLRGMGYCLTYLATHLSLKNGLRLFTREDLLKYLQKASAEDVKPLQLEGGVQK